MLLTISFPPHLLLDFLIISLFILTYVKCGNLYGLLKEVFVFTIRSYVGRNSKIGFVAFTILVCTVYNESHLLLLHIF